MAEVFSYHQLFSNLPISNRRPYSAVSIDKLIMGVYTLSNVVLIIKLGDNKLRPTKHLIFGESFHTPLST